VPWSDAELGFELQGLVDQLGVDKAYVRLVVTRGDGIGLRLPRQPKPSKVVYCLPAPVEPAETYRDGIALKRLLKGATERGPAPKTGNYLPNVLALHKAERAGFQDVLWTNADNEITEASASNIFFMARTGDAVEFVTPPAQSGLLLGITRATVIELLKRAGLPITEQIVYADELARFDEAFVCSTLRGLAPVSRIDQHKLFSARPAAVFRHIERLYLTWVETQVGFRVDWPTGRRL
jgi:branched-subunit amino acid aminotransferase/4-amino-4-deoxychorismate lyase